MAQERAGKAENTVWEPTSLHLFGFRGVEFEQARERFVAASAFRREYEIAQAAYDSLSEETRNHDKNLHEGRNELAQQVKDLQGSITCSLAYLTMLDELSERGLTPAEIFDFYKLCLIINTRATAKISRKINSDDLQLVLRRALVSAERGPGVLGSVLKEKLGNPPDWFGDDRKKWERFVSEHAFFTPYLNQHLANKYATTGFLPFKEIKNKYGLTSEGTYPDWLVESNGQPPSREEVEAELNEDLEAEAKLYEEINHSVRRSDYLRQMASQKFSRAAARIEQRKRETFPTIRTFTDAILFLEATRGLTEYSSDPSKMREMGFSDLKGFAVPPDKLFEKTIRAFVQSENTLMSKELVALWLERSLRERGIIEDSQDKIEESFVAFFDLAFKETRGGEKDLGLVGLRERDKKAFSSLQYSIKPLLEVLSEGERFYLQELITESLETAVEPIIWEIAELVAGHFKSETSVGSARQLRGVVEGMRRFVSGWLRGNWRWAFRKLQESFSPEQKLEPAIVPSVTEIVSGGQTVTDEVQEIEKAIQEVKLGNLAGWQLLYTHSMNTQEEFLVEIGGVSLREREESFEVFITKSGISCSIKPASVVRALEWVITVPQEVEQVRVRKEIGGEVFRKLKRGAVRIFYQVFPEERKIIFFVHQKKAWNYGF